MESFNTISCHIKPEQAEIWLNRPAKHNAINEEMISEFRKCIQILEETDHIKTIILRGKGESFCAGADLSWLTGAADPEENLQSSKALSDLLYEWYHIRKITIGMAHGSVIGGGIGLLAACDVTHALSSARFSFKEVRFGLVPATIMPYVVNRMGYVRTKELMLSGKSIDAGESLQYGLLHGIIPEGGMEAFIQQETAGMHQGEINAMLLVKELINDKRGQLTISGENAIHLSEILARLRNSKQVHERIDAFFKNKKNHDS